MANLETLNEKSRKMLGAKNDYSLRVTENPKTDSESVTYFLSKMLHCNIIRRNFNYFFCTEALIDERIEY